MLTINWDVPILDLPVVVACTSFFRHLRRVLLVRVFSALLLFRTSSHIYIRTLHHDRGRDRDRLPCIISNETHCLEGNLSEELSGYVGVTVTQLKVVNRDFPVGSERRATDNGGPASDLFYTCVDRDGSGCRVQL